MVRHSGNVDKVIRIPYRETRATAAPRLRLEAFSSLAVTESARE
jgi:hypothetical protein